ncbi:MAG: hypothetical protein CTY31_03850 [Hyphomicrobium sp.]|nr:MAG: hypothetical protein CTY39_00765 [Hyphomicrobium sp.]PPD01870.1 MAG: hypothetical protein CTY31_03850 [Hyphomicrobium sp.]
MLVNDNSLGGDNSIDALARLKFSDHVSWAIKRKMNALPSDYLAVHVRNTDYRTDYESYFSEIKDRVRDKTVVVCSDDVSCIAYARNFFTESSIMTVSEIPDTNGKTLHHNKKLNRYQTNLDALTDLIALSLSTELYFANVDKGFPSGYSRLANNLNRRKNIALNLFYKQPCGWFLHMISMIHWARLITSKSKPILNKVRDTTPATRRWFVIGLKRVIENFRNR